MSCTFFNDSYKCSFSICNTSYKKVGSPAGSIIDDQKAPTEGGPIRASFLAYGSPDASVSISHVPVTTTWAAWTPTNKRCRLTKVLLMNPPSLLIAIRHPASLRDSHWHMVALLLNSCAHRRRFSYKLDVAGVSNQSCRDWKLNKNW